MSNAQDGKKVSPGQALCISICLNIANLAVALTSLSIGIVNLGHDSSCNSTVNHPGFGLAWWVTGAGIGFTTANITSTVFTIFKYAMYGKEQNTPPKSVAAFEIVLSVLTVSWAIIWFGFGLAIYESLDGACADVTSSLIGMAIADLVFLGLTVGIVGITVLCTCCCVAGFALAGASSRN